MKDLAEQLKEAFKNASPERKYEMYYELRRLNKEAEEAVREHNAKKA